MAQSLSWASVLLVRYSVVVPIAFLRSGGPWLDLVSLQCAVLQCVMRGRPSASVMFCMKKTY